MLLNRAKRHDGAYDPIEILPRNTQLESHLANLLLTRNDPRAKLEVIRELNDCHLLSVASPISKQWDPYDIKPQVFALNTYLALPVFTSLQYLRAFCAKFNFRVCDPSGIAWTNHEQSNADPVIEAPQAQQREHRGDVWKALQEVKSFDIKQATPLQTFGPFVLPHFIGYFGDVNTVLHNMTIVPNSVDIVINPSTPLEFVLSREIADKFLRKEDLVLPALRRVEAELRAEFHQFLALECPEVAQASSVCLPLPAVMEERGDTHEITMVIDTSDWNQTIATIKRGKDSGRLVGHRSLHLLPAYDTPPHVLEGATVFYDGELHGIARQRMMAEEVQQRSKKRRQMNYGFFQSPRSPAKSEVEVNGNVDSGSRPSAGGGAMGFRQVGEPVTIQTRISSDNFYADPSLVYTEPWAV